jgi:long-chain acyl-CoA synthetase
MESRPWQRHYDYSVPTTIRYPRISVPELLQVPANSVPDKPATIFHGTEMSFYQVRHLVLRMANALGELGVRKGDRVGVQLPTSPQYMIAYYAVLSLGAIVTNMNPMYTVDELKYMVDHTGTTTIFTSDLTMDNIRKLCEQVEMPRVVITRMADFVKGAKPGSLPKLDLPEGWHHFSTLIDNCTNTKLPRVEIQPEDPAQIQFTGGTTGVPKGATLTHANVITAVLQCKQWGSALMEFTTLAERNVLVVLPYFHAYGNIVVMTASILNCSTQILMDRFDIDALMDLMAGFDRIGYFPSVPTMINAVINHPRAEELELDRRLGLLNSGAAPMPTELIERIKDMGISYSEGWGMSESTSVGISNPIMGLSKVGGIGVPFPDTDVKLVDVESGTEEVPIGEPGELIMRGPTVMKGYWGDPEKTADQIRDGWLFSGDIAVRDEDDFFFIVDRKKDMIIAGGYNVYPREVDEVLFQHPKILDAVAVGVDDEYRGETVKAFVVLKEGETATDKEIIGFCREKLAAYKAPKLVEFRDELPKSAVGKVLRKILREEEEAKKKTKKE